MRPQISLNHQLLIFIHGFIVWLDRNLVDTVFIQFFYFYFLRKLDLQCKVTRLFT